VARARHFAYGSEFTRDMREVVGLTYIDPTTGATSDTPAVLGAAEWAGPERSVYMLPMALMFRSDGRPTLACSVTYECGSYACSALQFAEGSGADPATLTLRSTLFDRTLGTGLQRGGAGRGRGELLRLLEPRRERRDGGDDRDATGRRDHGDLRCALGQRAAV
jgi:hypothetical protein